MSGWAFARELIPSRISGMIAQHEDPDLCYIRKHTEGYGQNERGIALPHALALCYRQPCSVPLRLTGRFTKDLIGLGC
jgi:hypothetical protein